MKHYKWTKCPNEFEIKFWNRKCKRKIENRKKEKKRINSKEKNGNI